MEGVLGRGRGIETGSRDKKRRGREGSKKEEWQVFCGFNSFVTTLKAINTNTHTYVRMYVYIHTYVHTHTHNIFFFLNKMSNFVHSSSNYEWPDLFFMCNPEMSFSCAAHLAVAISLRFIRASSDFIIWAWCWIGESSVFLNPLFFHTTPPIAFDVAIQRLLHQPSSLPPTNFITSFTTTTYLLSVLQPQHSSSVLTYSLIPETFKWLCTTTEAQEYQNWIAFIETSVYQFINIFTGCTLNLLTY